MRLLFVCSFGRDRSATAAALYHGFAGIEAKHGGVHRHAHTPATADLVQWADQIVCFTALIRWGRRRARGRSLRPRLR